MEVSIMKKLAAVLAGAGVIALTGCTASSGRSADEVIIKEYDADAMVEAAAPDSSYALLDN